MFPSRVIRRVYDETAKKLNVNSLVDLAHALLIFGRSQNANLFPFFVLIGFRVLFPREH